MRTNGPLPTLLAHVVDLRAHHSQAIQAGYRRLEAVLARDRAGATAGAEEAVLA